MFAGPALLTAMSDTDVTVVVTIADGLVPLLFVGFGSTVGEMPETVLVNGPLAGAVTVTMNVNVPPLVKAGIVGHVTMPLLFVPPPVVDTNTVFAGRLSLTTTLLAVEEPRFVTVTV